MVVNNWQTIRIVQKSKYNKMEIKDTENCLFRKMWRKG